MWEIKRIRRQIINIKFIDFEIDNLSVSKSEQTLSNFLLNI